MPDNMLVAIAVNDAYYLGVLSSRTHVTWALAAGSDLGGNTPRYNKTRCFETFPFPASTEEQQVRIRALAEQLDAHRKQRQALYPTLTVTDIYNTLESLRSGQKLNSKEQKINEQGLVTILLQLHKELDIEVAVAYGWPTNLSDGEILEKLVALHKERAAEESRGLVRWLRPEYQNPQGVQQAGLDVEVIESAIEKTTQELSEWPKGLAEQAQVVQRILQQYQHPVSPSDLNNHFKKGSKSARMSRQQQIENLLETFTTLGLLRKTENGFYVK